MNKFFLLLIILLLSSFDRASFTKENATFLNLLQDKKIDIVAPASGKDPKVIQELQNLPGLKLNFPTRCFNSPKPLFHSASDEVRLGCLKDVLFDKTTNVAWALRGGYGSAKLIEELSKLSKPENEKIFIGYSDMTALHLFFSRKWGWKTIHGSGIAEVLDSDKARENFVKIANIITGKTKQAVISGLVPLNKGALNSQDIRGVLTGGNLTIVITSIGTPWQIITHKKILFLEEVGIKPYQLDRTLYHLKHAGLLQEIKAIIFGEFSKPLAENLKVLQDFAAVMQVPVFKTNRFGHGKFNDPIIYNVDTHITIRNNKTYDLTMKLK